MTPPDRSSIRAAARELVAFGAVGAVGTLVNTLVLWVLHSGVGLHYLLAAAIATEVAIVSNFVGNDRLTFRARTTRHRRPARFLRFQLVSLTTVVGTLTLLWLQVRAFGERHVLVWNVIAIGVMFLANFAVNRATTWRRHANTP